MEGVASQKHPSAEEAGETPTSSAVVEAAGAVDDVGDGGGAGCDDGDGTAGDDGTDGDVAAEPWARSRRRYEREQLVAEMVSEGLQAQGLALAGGQLHGFLHAKNSWGWFQKFESNTSYWVFNFDSCSLCQFDTQADADQRAYRPKMWVRRVVCAYDVPDRPGCQCNRIDFLGLKWSRPPDSMDLHALVEVACPSAAAKAKWLASVGGTTSLGDLATHPRFATFMDALGGDEADTPARGSTGGGASAGAGAGADANLGGSVPAADE
jgi:hypothetical protein